MSTCHHSGKKSGGGGVLICILSLFANFGDLGKIEGFAQTIGMFEIPKVDKP